MRDLMRVIAVDIACQQRLFGFRQPLCLNDAVVEVQQDRDTQHERRQRFEHEEPLPAGET